MKVSKIYFESRKDMKAWWDSGTYSMKCEDKAIFPCVAFVVDGSVVGYVNPEHFVKDNQFNQVVMDEIINRFKKSVLSLAQLRSDEKQLSAQFYLYSQALGYYLEEYSTLHSKRRLMFQRLVSKHRGGFKSKTDTASHVETLPEFIEVYEDEYRAKGLVDKFKIIHKSIESTLSSMRQNIAQLRDVDRHKRSMEEYASRR